MIDEIISLCCKQDAKTWAIANNAIIKYIPAAKYSLVVPDSELGIFQTITNPKFNVQPESRYAKDIKGPLSKILPQSKYSLSRWYLQQFIKLEILNQLSTNKIAVLWDGDTVPLQPINFVNKYGKLNYFTGTENHAPYFETIHNLLGLDKQVPHSFISQSFPIKTQWFQEFKNSIESHSGKSWFEAILDAINFSHNNAFSEYETLGSFIAHKHREEICLSYKPWLRLGNSLIGDARLIHTLTAQARLAQYQYVSFEKWDRAKPTFFKVTLPIFIELALKPCLARLTKKISADIFFRKPKINSANISRHSDIKSPQTQPSRIFISFANHSYQLAQQLNTKSALKIGGFDTAWEYTPESLDEIFINQNRKILNQSKGSGYWLWKPYIILDALLRSEPGDIIMYSDSASYFIKPANELFELLDTHNQDIIPFELEFPESAWTKRDAFTLCDVDEQITKDTRQRCGSPIIIRNSDFSKSFFNEFLKIASDPRSITDQSNELGQSNFPNFVAHRHDQSLFSLLSKKYGLIAFRDPSQWGNPCKDYYTNSTYPQIVNLTRRQQPKLIDKIDLQYRYLLGLFNRLKTFC